MLSSVTNQLISHQSSFITLFLIALLVSPIPVSFADPEPLQDFCIADLEAQPSINGFPCKPASMVTSDDFLFDGLTKEGNTGNIFGANVTAGNVLAFLGLNTLGLSMNRVDFAPGAVNPPHIHPRSTELVLVVKGKLLVGFLTTGFVYHSKVVSAGEIFVIPRGLVHFQKNVGKGKAMSFTAFDSQLPGVVVLLLTLIGSTPSIPDDVLTKGFHVDEDVVKAIKSKFGN